MSMLYGTVGGNDFVAWVETDEGVVAIDTGWDLASGKGYEGSDVEALVLASEKKNKQVTHILLTHDHVDHCANLPFLLERWPAAEVYAHANSGVKEVSHHLQGGERLVLGTIPVEVIYTPGHSANRDELCYYLPEEDFLFSGDVAQPQGPSYTVAIGPSPVPYFHEGEDYRCSLETLIQLGPHRMRTGHGDFLGPEQTKQWLRVTLATVTRIEELAITLVERYPHKDADWLAELLYDHIADERHFGYRAANKRKRHSSYEGATDYERYDKPGLLWMIQQAQAM